MTFRNTRLKLYGKFALNKSTDVRLDVVHDRQDLNEWTWSNGGLPFSFADNTTVGLKSNQRVTFVGMSWQHRFR